jgi:predicted RNase H-like nuclease (RuvC/YqgF family)
MAKKGLGDLLREEAQKSLESEVVGTVERSQELVQKSPDTPNNAEPASAQTVDVAAQPVAPDHPEDTAAKAKRSSSTGSKSTNAKAATTKSATSKVDASDDDADAKSGTPDTSGLEATIAELRKDLEAARKTEKSLLDKISAIQADLDEQKSLAQKLQAEVKHGKKLESELEEAKKVILQLTESNAKTEPAPKLEPAAKQPEPVQANRAAAKKEFAKPQSAQLARVPKPPAPESGSRDYRSHRIVLEERIPQHSMHKHYPSKTTSDADLGWFD